jgi:O-antigen/teichoic acid export membrane protein
VKLISKLIERNAEEFNLLSHAKNFGIGSIFIKGLAFITIPIFTRLLTVEDYGVISLFSVTTSILVILYGLGFNLSINRYYFEKNGDFESFLGSHLIYSLCYMSILSIFLYAFREPISFLVGIPQKVFVYAITISFFSLFVTVYQQLKIVRKQSVSYSIFQCILQISIVVVSILLVAQFTSDKYLGKILGGLIIVPFSIFSLFQLAKNSKWKFKRSYFYYTAQVAFPSVPGMLAGIVLVQIDRVFIIHYIGIESTGLYSYAYALGMIISIFFTSILSSWEPIFFDFMGQKRIRDVNRLTMFMLWFICSISAIIILFAREVSFIMAPERFQAAVIIIPIVLLSYVINDHGSLYTKYIVYDKKYIPYTPIAVIIAGLVNVGLNYMFIPKFGYKVAAVTTLLSYCVVFVIYYMLAVKAMGSFVIKLNKTIKPYGLVFFSCGLYYFLDLVDLQLLSQMMIKIMALLVIITMFFWKVFMVKND